MGLISGDIHEKLVEVTHMEDDLIACTDKIPSLFLDRAGRLWRAEMVKMTSGANNSKAMPAYQLHVTREIGVDGATQGSPAANQQPRLICCGTPSCKLAGRITTAWQSVLFLLGRHIISRGEEHIKHISSRLLQLENHCSAGIPEPACFLQFFG